MFIWLLVASYLFLTQISNIFSSYTNNFVFWIVHYLIFMIYPGGQNFVLFCSEFCEEKLGSGRSGINVGKFLFSLFLKS